MSDLCEIISEQLKHQDKHQDKHQEKHQVELSKTQFEVLEILQDENLYRITIAGKSMIGDDGE